MWDCELATIESDNDNKGLRLYSINMIMKHPTEIMQNFSFMCDNQQTRFIDKGAMIWQLRNKYKGLEFGRP